MGAEFDFGFDFSPSDFSVSTEKKKYVHIKRIRSNVCCSSFTLHRYELWDHACLSR